MAEHLYVVSSEWGGAKGGLNVFNKALVEGLARVTGAGVKIIAVVAAAQSIPTSPGAAFSFLPYDGTGKGLADKIKQDTEETPHAITKIVIIGHDVHTGHHALEARNVLRAEQHNCVAGVFCHMDYSAYQKFKFQPIERISQKVEMQRDIIRNADHVYAVGPLLSQAFTDLRGASGAKTPVQQIIPGVPDTLSQLADANPAKALHFFFSGRIDPENDPIKNGRLALQAICDAYEKNRRSNETRWQQRGQFTAFGLADGVTDDWFCATVKGRQYREHVTITPRPFADQETVFAELRNSHIAIMPSIHEGFGLAGWEALCAGIPLICSRHTGLADFLEGYFSTNHLVPRESILFVGVGNENDVAMLTSTIEEMVQTYDRRRSQARKLAENIQRDFTWDTCAQKVASSLGLAQAGPQDWQLRQFESNAALALVGASEATVAVVERALNEARATKSLTEWSLTCTALNYISDIGRTPTHTVRQDAFGKLEVIAAGIDAGYDANCAQEPYIRMSGRFDVAWRFMAAASGVAGSFLRFAEVIPHRLLREIQADSFLNRELLQYAMKFAHEFDNVSEEVARAFFVQVLESAPANPALQTRFARLEAAYPTLATVASLDGQECPFYIRERDRCESVRASRFELNDLAIDHRLGPTALALATLSADFRERGIDQIFIAGREHNHPEPALAWRGDKLLRSALLGAILHPKALLDFVVALAQDEEEALRWAAIDLAFSPALRSRLFNASRAGTLEESPFQLRQRLGAIVDRAVEEDGCHPWMQREFLDRFYIEHNGATLPIEERFTAGDFPFARGLFGPAVGEAATWRFTRLHPEVHGRSQKLREKMRRVLLVLPPISLAPGGHDVSHTSTPPLGLGMVGSCLLADGHDVHLADCHRTPSLAGLVMESAPHFQWIGFNTVLPSMRSTLQMASKIKQAVPTPAVVVGGPAVNAGAFRNAVQSPEEATSWDFAINARAEENFAFLVASAARGDTLLPHGIDANERSALVLGAGHRSDSARPDAKTDRWPDPILLDRRLFSTPKGQYEPQPTRAIHSTTVEAHIVMSRGCDWNCSFCTERRDQSGGERRRALHSVERELHELTLGHENLRVQFIDDNLLPQIGALPQAERVARAEALSWTEGFLLMLTKIKNRRQDRFGWRGIFRVEDFIAYEAKLSGFIDRLRASGCRMLAFGIEHGNEAKRRKMKLGDSASNSEFQALFERLRASGIHSKAYFILGGPNETVDTAEETINFAIQSGASLAYFALYKQFVPALSALRKDQPVGSDIHPSYSHYEQLQIDWDAVLKDAGDNPGSPALAAFVARIDPAGDQVDVDAMLTCYSQLSRLGFRFADLVKYSDHHAVSAPAAKILSKVNFGDQEAFAAKVAAAYIRFYTRPTFLETYQSLLESGY